VIRIPIPSAFSPPSLPLNSTVFPEFTIFGFSFATEESFRQKLVGKCKGSSEEKYYRNVFEIYNNKEKREEEAYIVSAIHYSRLR